MITIPQNAYCPVYECNVTILGIHWDSCNDLVITAKPDNYDYPVKFRESELIFDEVDNEA